MNEEQFQDLLRKTCNKTNIVLDVVDQDNSLLNRKARTSKFTLLHYPCLFSNFSLVKELVKRGSNIHAKNSNAMDLLYQAIHGHNKNLSIISFLLEKGADPCSSSNYWTALLDKQLYMLV
jgi:ankyrin repeat protein